MSAIHLTERQLRSKLLQLKIGDEFGRWEIIGVPVPTWRVNARQRFLAVTYRCRCKCGTEADKDAHGLINKDGQSCGCLRHDVISRERRTHGLSKTRLYRIRTMMIARCENENFPSHRNYGERGIKICDEWRNDAAVFVAWALANGYRDNLTIERKDNDLGYCPENCTWIPLADQASNTRQNRKLTAFGETKTLTAWSRDPRCIVTFRGLLDRANHPERGLVGEAMLTTARLK